MRFGGFTVHPSLLPGGLSTSQDTRTANALHLDSTDVTSLGLFRTALPKLDTSAKVSLLEQSKTLSGMCLYFCL